jgi:hypothetical protein
MKTSKLNIEIKQAETGYYRLYINGDCAWNEEWDDDLAVPELRGSREEAEAFFAGIIKYEVAWHGVNGEHVALKCCDTLDEAKAVFSEHLHDNAKFRLSNYKWAKHMSPYDTAQQDIYSLAITASVLSDAPYRYDERESANYYLPGDRIDFA